MSVPLRIWRDVYDVATLHVRVETVCPLGALERCMGPQHEVSNKCVVVTRTWSQSHDHGTQPRTFGCLHYIHQQQCPLSFSRCQLNSKFVLSLRVSEFAHSVVKPENHTTSMNPQDGMRVYAPAPGHVQKLISPTCTLLGTDGARRELVSKLSCLRAGTHCCASRDT